MFVSSKTLIKFMGETGLFQEWVPVGGGRHKEKVNEGEYGGYILYSYMKIEE
jgi:hypothetical protein